jgi:hypothetical protein
MKLWLMYRNEFLAGEVWDALAVDAVDTQGICLGCHTAGYAQQGKCNGENILFHKREMFIIQREMFYHSFNCANGSS